MKCQRRDRREEGKGPSVDQGLGQDPLQNEELDGQEWRIFNFLRLYWTRRTVIPRGSPLSKSSKYAIFRSCSPFFELCIRT